MMLRSSSTPLLRSLLSSFSESPQKHPTSIFHHNCTKSLSHSPSPSVAEIKGTPNGLRRVLSEGNLVELGNDSHNVDDFTYSNQHYKKFSHKPTLEPIPSFPYHNLETCSEDYDSDDEEEEEEELQVEGSFNPFIVQNLVSHQEVRMNADGYGNMGFFQDEGKMYLATGVGVPAIGFSGGGGGGGGSNRPVDFNRDGGDSRGLSMEEHYKSMLEQSPGNPLFLRNYAHFLYQEKGDLEGAEEYYSRAILADPEDGEVLCQYAKLIWELHHDKERAAAYFERAVQASSEDSHVNASYASFLWDTEEDEDEENASI